MYEKFVEHNGRLLHEGENIDRYSCNNMKSFNKKLSKKKVGLSSEYN